MNVGLSYFTMIYYNISQSKGKEDWKYNTLYEHRKVGRSNRKKVSLSLSEESVRKIIHLR